MLRYKAAYAAIGEERVQYAPKTFEETAPVTRHDKKMFQNAEDTFWGPRQDRNWADIPGYMKFVRRTRKREFFEGVSQILMHLEPSVAFNPADLWRKEKEREKEREKELEEAVQTTAAEKAKKIDQMKELNAQKSDTTRLNRELKKIRNSKNDLLAIVKDIKYPEARAVLLMQILNAAYTDFTKTRNKKILYEVYWAIEELQLPEKGLTPVTDKKLALVYDNYDSVKKLLRDVKKVLTDESDIIRYQLLEMSDALPPLSRFSHGFRLDPWQKKVLNWIDDGKSVVICAPTSSGKTVLSSYVAMIFKSHVEAVADDKGDAKPAAAPAQKTISTIKIDGEDVEVADDDEEEELEEEEQEEQREEANAVAEEINNLNVADAANPNAVAVDNEERRLCIADRAKRMEFLSIKQSMHQQGIHGTGQKVLFVVPTEPLVWQVAAYFTKLMKEEGDKHTVVGIVTDHMTFSPMRSLNTMPQIVVGTPKALESALTKARGLAGHLEVRGKPAGNILAGGFDHFDWAIYDEVHALDGEEGAALQRIIRSMTCPFLALSATIGNAEQLRDWLALVKQQQLHDVQVLDIVNPSAATTGAAAVAASTITANAVVEEEKTAVWTTTKMESQFTRLPNVALAGDAANRVEYTVWNTVGGEVVTISVPEALNNTLTMQQMKLRINEVWKHFMVDSAKAAEQERPYLQVFNVTSIAPSFVVGEEGEGNISLKSFATSKHLIVSSEFRVSLVNMSTGKLWAVSQASKDATVHSLKAKISELSKEETVQPVVCIFRGKEIAESTLETATNLPEHEQFLFKHNLFIPQAHSHTQKHTNERFIYFRFFQVHECVGNTGRFINLQRYLWSPQSNSQKLFPLSPLTAVPDAAALDNGILEQSSLSFTSKDSFKVWEELKKAFPEETIAFLSPYNFFNANTRITLQQTKEYEDLLKKGLKQLAHEHPTLMDRVLKVFAVQETERELDLVDLLLELRNKDLLPALPFHLNTFEAIKLFQHVVAGMEYRQKVDHPNHYTSLHSQHNAKDKAKAKQVKNTGGNEKLLEEQMRAGDIESVASGPVDDFAPDLKYTFCCGSPLNKNELDVLMADMERYDGFEKSMDHANANGAAGKAQNVSILRHALIRGLRRGVGLFVDEVSFPSYRRMVQKLASLGRLGVVISDGSLAFGVNMPFRTTIFSGEMHGQLDELMAQQMSGRAGRRGLDTQGNIIYAGLRMPLVRRLMIGTVSHITGQHYYPKYDSLYLQAILSPRHTGYARTAVLGGISLQEYVQQHPIVGGAEAQHTITTTNDAQLASLTRRDRIHAHTPMPEAHANPHYAFAVSRQAMMDLGFITMYNLPSREHRMTHAILTMVWELRDTMPQSITVGQLFTSLLDEFRRTVTESVQLSFEKQKILELMEPHVASFFCILIQLVDRTPYSPHHEDIRILDDPYFHQGNRLEMYHRWEKLFDEQQANIPEHLAHLRNPIPAHTVLDGTFFRCCLDRNYIHTLSDAKKQLMKAKIWHLGNVIKILNNSAVLDDDLYVRLAFFIFRNAFEKLRYLNSELIRSMINIENITEFEREKRGEKGEEVMKMEIAGPWSELNTLSTWSEGIEHILAIGLDLKGALQTPSAREELVDMMYPYLAIREEYDYDFIAAVIDFDAAAQGAKQIVTLSKAIAKTSFVKLRKLLPEVITAGTNTIEIQRELRAIGVVIWFVTVLQPAAKAKFRYYIHAMHNEAIVSTESVVAWNTMSYDEMVKYFPTTELSHKHHQEDHRSHKHAGKESNNAVVVNNKIKEDEVEELKVLAEEFVTAIQEEEEEEEDDEEEEEEDDE